MIGIVLVTHGRLAQEFISAMEHMVGPQTHLRAVCIGPEDDIERRQREIAAAAKSVDMGRGVVIATDMFGGTPCNLALTILERGKIEVLAGVNLPSLIKLIDVRNKLPLDQAVKDLGTKITDAATKVPAIGAKAIAKVEITLKNPLAGGDAKKKAEEDKTKITGIIDGFKGKVGEWQKLISDMPAKAKDIPTKMAGAFKG